MKFPVAGEYGIEYLAYRPQKIMNSKFIIIINYSVFFHMP